MLRQPSWKQKLLTVKRSVMLNFSMSLLIWPWSNGLISRFKMLVQALIVGLLYWLFTRAAVMLPKKKRCMKSGKFIFLIATTKFLRKESRLMCQEAVLLKAVVIFFLSWLD